MSHFSKQAPTQVAQVSLPAKPNFQFPVLAILLQTNPTFAPLPARLGKLNQIGTITVPFRVRERKMAPRVEVCTIPRGVHGGNHTAGPRKWPKIQFNFDFLYCFQFRLNRSRGRDRPNDPTERVKCPTRRHPLRTGVH